jgi:predicted cobalt transporter CbtA
MLRTLLICGLLAGVVGGLLGSGFASVAGEPSIDRAIAFEEAQATGATGDADHTDAAGAPAHSHDAGAGDAALVSRDVQKSVGLITAAVVYGLALGGLFALIFAFVYGRVGRASPARTALWLAAGAFAVVFLVPFLKYPANPPAVGDPETIGRRTGLYFVMVASSILLAVAAIRVRAALVKRGTSSGASTLAALATYLVSVVAVALALPGVHEIPSAFPATTLWDFRIASIGVQAVMWASIGLVFAGAARRVMSGQPLWPWRAPRSRRVAAGTGD